MTIQYSLIAAYAVGIILLYILGRVLLFPMKILLKFIYNSVLGGVALLVVNYIGGFFKFNLALNLISAFTVGVLGIPGIILLAVLKTILKI
jgi:inhibitor of the pro-sigma K processing machinery